jgi:hypothetical protein
MKAEAQPPSALVARRNDSPQLGAGLRLLGGERAARAAQRVAFSSSTYMF